MKKRIREIPYLSILKNSFVLAWKNPYLWWFGFFLALSNLGSLNYTRDSQEKDTLDQILTNYHSLDMQFIIAGTIVLLIIFVIIIILGIISRGALIDSIEKHVTKINCDFKTAWKAGKNNFWKILFTDILCGLFILGAMIVLFPPIAFLFWNHNYIIGSFMALIAAVIFIPLMILVAYLRIFGYIYAVIGKLKVWTSLENAYALFRKNIGTSIVMAIFLFPVSLLTFFIVLLAAVPLIFVFAPLALVFFLIAGKIGAAAIGIFGVFILAVIMIFLRSLIEVFTQSVWIMFFHEIATPEDQTPVAEPVSEIDSSIDSVPNAPITSERE